VFHLWAPTRLRKKLGSDGQGVGCSSQVVPFPWDTSVQLVVDYQAAEKFLDPKFKAGLYIFGRDTSRERLVASALEKDRAKSDTRRTCSGLSMRVGKV